MRYENRLKFLDKIIYDTTYYEKAIFLIIYSAIGFFIPMFFSHPQLIVGSVVNMTIILAAFHLKKWEILPICILPSIGAIFHGMLFGPFTIFVVYMMPFIWTGNFLLVICIKKFYVEKKINYAYSLPISIIFKATLLFISALIFVSLGILPKLFLAAMGLLQVYTALIGGIAAYSVMKARRLFNQD